MKKKGKFCSKRGKIKRRRIAMKWMKTWCRRAMSFALGVVGGASIGLGFGLLAVRAAQWPGLMVLQGVALMAAFGGIVMFMMDFAQYQEK
jgi:hypothetical protein